MLQLVFQLLFTLSTIVGGSFEDLNQLPVLGADRTPTGEDWLIKRPQLQAEIFRSTDGRELILDNGLVRRRFRIEPNVACVGYEDLYNNQQMLRAVHPEARITIDGQTYDVGGLTGQRNHAFLSDQTIDTLQADDRAMQFVGFQTDKIKKRLEWKRRRHSGGSEWPPAGLHVQFDYRMPAEVNKEITVSVHYELYDGLPLCCKWITIHNRGDSKIIVDKFVSEELALVEQANWVEYRAGVDVPRPDYLHVETDFAFGGFNAANANRHVVHWETDPEYNTQVNWARKTPCLLKVHPTYGPSQTIMPGGQFESYRTFELAYGNSDRERKGLARRRMYRTIAPWVTENPITHHLLNNQPEKVIAAIDQAAEVGFEAIILSFGSGFNMENRQPDFLARWKEVADYAEKKGVELGAYSLFSSRNVGQEHMIVSPEGQKPTHGQCPAVTSEWGQQWLQTVGSFFDKTGFDQFENDGPYPGDVDVTPRTPWQQGAPDSRWVQWRETVGLYRRLRSRGVYVNAPDYYYLNGSNKCGMGYRETNWSLPREEQLIHTRQNIYDGTWTKTPSMGWMFVPLSQYHGGGEIATIEPLAEHIDHYQSMLLSNFGLGVQAHYRGPRLYDTKEVKEMVRESVQWFKKYRDILESDLIHGRRADGRGLDWMLHVNPELERRGMLCVFNPTDQPIHDTIRVNLYYTGLRNSATVWLEDKQPSQVNLGEDAAMTLKISVPAGEMVWYVIRDSKRR